MVMRYDGSNTMCGGGVKARCYGHFSSPTGFLSVLRGRPSIGIYFTRFKKSGRYVEFCGSNSGRGRG